MRRKKRAKGQRHWKSHKRPQFKIGQAVQVRTGAMDPDFNDVSLAGWSGVVRDVDSDAAPRAYFVEWDPHTVEAMPLAYRQRCENDGLDWECIWLIEDDLAPCAAERAPLHAETRLASVQVPEKSSDRVRAVFGLSPEAPLPPVNKKNLKRYHRYLKANLAFPLDTPPVGRGDGRDRAQRLLVVGLLELHESDLQRGLECAAISAQEGPLVVPLVDVEPSQVDDARLIDDYRRWYQGENLDVMGVADGSDRHRVDFLMNRLALVGLLAILVVMGALCGAGVATLLSFSATSGQAAMIGAGVLALLAYWVFSIEGHPDTGEYRCNLRPRLGNIPGTLCGGFTGAMLGAAMVAFAGWLAGAIIGALFGWFVLRRRWVLSSALAGSLLGAVAQAFFQNHDSAVAAVLYGAPIGAGMALGLALLAIVVVWMFDLDIHEDSDTGAEEPE